MEGALKSLVESQLTPFETLRPLNPTYLLLSSRKNPKGLWLSKLKMTKTSKFRGSRMMEKSRIVFLK
jgi:hypothetical protein